MDSRMKEVQSRSARLACDLSVLIEKESERQSGMSGPKLGLGLMLEIRELIDRYGGPTKTDADGQKYDDPTLVRLERVADSWTELEARQMLTALADILNEHVRGLPEMEATERDLEMRRNIGARLRNKIVMGVMIRVDDCAEALADAAKRMDLEDMGELLGQRGVNIGRALDILKAEGETEAISTIYYLARQFAYV